MLDFLLESSRSGFPALSKLSTDDVCSVWGCVCDFIENQLALQKGVQIPGLGTFTLSRIKLDVGNNKFIVMQRPIFLLSEKFAQVHGVAFSKSFSSGDIPVVPLNFVAVALATPYTRDTVEGCIKETINIFSRSVATKQNVEFNFKGIGVLHIRDLKVKMKFFKDFINSLDGTGSLMKSLSNRPGTCDSVMSDRQSVERPRSCSAVLFPTIEVKEAHNSPAMETIAEETAGADSAEDQVGHLDKEREEENIRKRESSRRLLNRQRMVPARVTGISFDGELDGFIKPKTAPERLRSSLSASLPKAQGERCSSRADVLQIHPPPSPGCSDHCRAGQELCYLCMQRAKKNIPVYFTEEKKLRELEEERVLQQYQHMKDQEALQKTQVASLMNKEQSQKDAAYNLGIADAIRNEKNRRNTAFYKSYIFEERPLTPPAALKQKEYYQYLTKQMTGRKEKEVRQKQDQELLDRLEKVQLAEELAAQRTKYFKDRNEQTQCYKTALDTQVKMKPSFVPTPPADLPESMFGKNDMTNEKLAERSKRAQDLYKDQTQAAAERRRLIILNELVQQRNEADMVQKSKQQMLADRNAQYEKISKLQKALTDDWAKSSEIKRQKDCEEQQFIRAGSHLLLDQFEKYRRCFQCKRRTTNCGETNIWCESRYIPGSRLMV
ncbi:coiled-coil domain-containing protein 81 [Spea bombifrons]|uniref:coiled-coil domain-containing protein 81 n=1 Tax=Spea bombifrons TaxID=233779 RepID=UPI00234B6939|nr:coiled-coil domain-containing protein 81 [Spea bombifrons]